MDLEGAVVVPGFVDSHQHIDNSYACVGTGGADGLAQAIARSDAWRATLTEDDILRRGRRLLLELVNHGVCAVRTHCDIDTTFGLRGIAPLLALKDEFADRVHLQLVAFPNVYAVPPEQPTGHRLLRQALAMGCDAVGGAPHLSASPHAHVDAILRLANDYGCLVDMHVDELDTPGTEHLSYIADATVREGLQGLVTCSHCCSLALLPDREADLVIEKVLQAGLHIAACPLTNLYLQGGDGRVPGFRGLTRVKDLMKAGVNVVFGADNIRDAFNPYGNGDPLLAAMIGGTAARLGTAEELRWLLHGVTAAGARALGLAGYGLDVGCRADLVVLACENVADVVPAMARRRLVILNGRVVSGELAGRHAGAPIA